VGTKLFAPKPMNPSGLNLQARAQGTGAYAARAQGGAVNKDLQQAMALYKAHAFKPSTGTAAYPAGPKKV